MANSSAIAVLLLTALSLQWGVRAEQQLEDVIGTWATEFGEELWQLGQTVTKLTEIKASYKKQNAEVKRREGEEVLAEIVDNLQTMMKKKVDAVKCIIKSAEEKAEEFTEADRAANYTYYSAKYSAIEGEPEGKGQGAGDPELYRGLWLQPHRHFNNIPVNMSHSAVHVPTNLYDQESNVLMSIQWSEALNDVYMENYMSDPALSWQYFGDATGFLRLFPAMHWNQEVDQYDYRYEQAYTEAATCTKDMIILMDTTGSMTGMRINIARLTVSNLLDTLTNNDFVNVFNFSETAQEVVPCYKDMLVQATAENVNTFKEAVALLKPEGHGNFSVVFTQAFELLQRYREIRGCSNDTGLNAVRCNQVIMLVTDGVPYNITEVFEEYNWLGNGTNIPVRIFTYLIGREVFKVKEIQLIACQNKGYYTHVHSLNEVRQQVFKYVPVLARPLVLQGDVHPVTWTNVYADITDLRINEWLWDVMENAEQKDRMYKYFRNKKLYFSQRDSDRRYVQQLKKESDEIEGHIRYREYHLMVSISIPAFDRKTNNNNESRTADLLGVAGTDILLDHIQSLTNPYKIGVNGYAFIVNNNGYLLLHPDLRPVSRGALKDNFNSVDLTEVELMDEEEEPRYLPPEILQLREAMVNQSTGKVEKLRIKYHYDDMHRAAVEERSYFYAPLPGTPFSVGLSLAEGYGYNSISVRDEVMKAHMLKVPLITYFYGWNWKLRPDWVYCRYHHEHMFTSAEQELRHFLDKMSAADWEWRRQYHTDPLDSFKYTVDDDAEHDTDFAHCDNKPDIDNEDYYCNKDLMLLLMFDAKVTCPTFENPRYEFKNKAEEDLLLAYNATLRFISTQSGLTRWQYMLETDEKDYHRTEFGNLHKRAIEEPWYIAAVLQHQVDPDSFVYSLSFDRIGLTEGDAFVTASHAIFHRDGGQEAPASVVGLQFRQTALLDRFMKISSNPTCPDCREQCLSDQLDCFVLDSGGYILLTENQNDTGLFFGEVEGAVMEAMLHENVYRRVTVYDYQALCFEEILKRNNDASLMLTPFRLVQWFVRWLFGELLMGLLQTNVYQLWTPVTSVPFNPADLEEEYYDSVEVEDIDEELEFANKTKDPDEIEWETINHPCDQKTDLYLLQHDHLKRLHKEGYRTAFRNCSKPFYLRRIPHSNLLLVVVDAMYPSCYRKLSTEPVELHDNSTFYPCQKVNLVDLPRRKLGGCFTEHPDEVEITECGDVGSRINHSHLVVLLCLFASLFSTFTRHR